MKKFKVTVNGKAYDVEVEDLGTSGPAPAAIKQAAPTPPPAAARAAVPKPAPAAPVRRSDTAAGEGVTLNAPMPGTILSVNVAEGDAVTKGQVLLILEAMKMENEIMAVADGMVVSINVSKGASVSAGDPLLILNFN